MMGNTPEYRLMNQAYSYKKVRITQCDPATGYLEARDSANQQIKITFSFFHSPYVQVPKVDEYWLITRLDNNWVIHSRFENEQETFSTKELIGGDVRINAPSRLFLNPEQELICDFNKAKNSFSELGTATFPGSALYGSATLDQVNAGTVNIGDRLITPLKTYLPTRNVVNGQEEKILISQDNIVWGFRYRSNSSSSYKWDFVGGTDYMGLSTALVSGSVVGAWYNTKSPSIPALTIPYTGEYIISIGAEVTSTNNNSSFSLGLSLNEGIPISILTTQGYVHDANTSLTVSNSYKLTSNIINLQKGDILREGFKINSAVHSTVLTFKLMWMKIAPIRVQADPADDPEPITILPYDGAG